MSEADPRPCPVTLDSNCSLSGTLHIRGDVLLLGRFEGTLDVAGRLEVGPDASLHGRARVGSLRVRGVVEAKVVSTGAVELCGGGELRGGVSTPRLQAVADAVPAGSAGSADRRPQSREDAAVRGVAPPAGVAQPAGAGSDEGARPAAAYVGVLHRRTRRRVGAAMSPTSTG
ncbi:polymer-forming cytoskeletal protein [Phycisphaera mikurensis]|nr:polymer-forming cytoskeletal protein [Phycisphaera mikurensis]